ncbi:MAG: hypothetical protein H0T85_09435 [Geodermatophilaceae bacterium]|nr:hypothetical protein [Geodermatophilaceae bacterium]
MTPESGLSRPEPAAVAPVTWRDPLRPAPGELANSTRLATWLCLLGIPVGVLWWLVAPRRAYRVSAEGAFAVVAESEAAVGSDGWLLLMLTVVGILGGAFAWWRVRPRGPYVPVGLAVGMFGCGLLAWFVGSLLGSGPSAADLAEVGAVVLGPLGLGAGGVLIMGPFVAVAGYAIGVCFARRDDLG